MKLKEYEGKSILQEFGIAIPKGLLVKNAGELSQIHFSQAVIKPQVLAGGRGKAGIIKLVHNKQIIPTGEALLDATFYDEKIEELLVEEKVEHTEEWYLSITFSTETRTPILLFSEKGGVDIEQQKPKVFEINALHGVDERFAQNVTSDKELQHVIIKLYKAFETYNARLVEINPLARTSEGFVALDAKIILDDESLKRNPRQFPKRTGLRQATPREIEARKIDEEDYRGVAGKSFIDLDGDIAVLASGGGASLTAMDALLSYGGRPANYVEYSGNPSAEKVKKLTLITLNKPGLKGCWVVGGTANFTRIDETIRGFIEALVEIKPKYPIIVRRAGPGDKEAFAMLKVAAHEHGFDIRTYGEEMPVTASAKIMVEAAYGSHR